MSIFIIAEIGINHNGSVDLCKKLIDIASIAGCDAVKLQKRDIDLVYTKKFLDSHRESPWGKTQRDQKQGLEFDVKEYDIINEYCKNKGIHWFASAWDFNSQKFLHKYDLKYNKIASAMLPHKSFLEKVADENKHTFISTGMSTLDMIDSAVEIFIRKKCSFELMHCRSVYPMNENDANLNVIDTLKNRYKCNVGYSGHEPGLAVSYAAAAKNISSLERHITLDRSMYGSDQSASVEPAGLIQLVGAVRKIENAFGNGIKDFDSEEMAVAEKLRAHLEHI